MQHAEEPVRNQAGAGPSGESGALPHVLVLDDDGDTLEMLSFLLGHSGYRVTPVGSVLAARASLEQDPPDVAVLDVSLNGEPLGLDVARAARAKEHVVIVLHTALPEEVVRLEFDRYDAFLRKPASMRTMLTVLAETLARRL